MGSSVWISDQSGPRLWGTTGRELSPTNEVDLPWYPWDGLRSLETSTYTETGSVSLGDMV